MSMHNKEIKMQASSLKNQMNAMKSHLDMLQEWIIQANNILNHIEKMLAEWERKNFLPIVESKKELDKLFNNEGYTSL
jgi:biotin-(acetyl-CoA carboxylase) ligase